MLNYEKSHSKPPNQQP